VPVQLEQDRPQTIRELDRICNLHRHFVTYGNEWRGPSAGRSFG
jgi:hypothetical protein